MIYLFDRPLYGGGATFARMLRPIWAEETQYQVNSQPEIPTDYTGVPFLWGLGLSHHLKTDLGPVKWFTVLREPVARFFSIIHAIRTAIPKESFWESELLRDCSDMKSFVDKYTERHDTYLRSQFSELLEYMDYSGLEHQRAPEVYTENLEYEKLSEAEVIQKMEEKFDGIYLLEYQEETLFQFVIQNKLPHQKLFETLPEIQKYTHSVSKWQIKDTDEETMEKVKKLVAKESAIYYYFKQKFLDDLSPDILQKTTYHVVKSRSLRENAKILQDFKQRTGKYTTKSFFGTGPSATQYEFIEKTRRGTEAPLNIQETQALKKSVQGKPFVIWGTTDECVNFLRHELAGNLDNFLGFVDPTLLKTRIPFCGLNIPKPKKIGKLLTAKEAAPLDGYPVISPFSIPRTMPEGAIVAPYAGPWDDAITYIRSFSSKPYSLHIGY